MHHQKYGVAPGAAGRLPSLLSVHHLVYGHLQARVIKDESGVWEADSVFLEVRFGFCVVPLEQHHDSTL